MPCGRIVVRCHIHRIIHAAIAHKRREGIHSAQAKILTVLNHPLAHPSLLAGIALAGDRIAIGVAQIIDQIGNMIGVPIVVIRHKMTVIGKINTALQTSRLAKCRGVIPTADAVEIIGCQCVAIIIIARVIARVIPRSLPPARCLARVEAVGKGDINTFGCRTRIVHHFVVNDKILIVVRMRRGKPLARPFQTRGRRTAFLNTDQLGKIIFGQRLYPRRRAVLWKIPRTNAVGKRLRVIVPSKTEVPDHNRPILSRRCIGNAVGCGPPVGSAVGNR